ncbi:hypothetical protein [Actinoplanes sp. NPDC049681]|uniref:hypothetical protein n=1 Tax=Actinoplanes sp. NPDC049681 TaxID=3363905 RepID=UPI0037BD363B
MDRSKVLELHSLIRETVCTGCGARTPATIDRPGRARRCAGCGGILDLVVVMVGARLDPAPVGRIASLAKSYWSPEARCRPGRRRRGAPDWSSSIATRRRTTTSPPRWSVHRSARRSRGYAQR